MNVLLRLATAGLAPRLKQTSSTEKFGLTRQVICPFQVPKEVPTKVPKVPRKRRDDFCGTLKLLVNSENVSNCVCDRMLTMCHVGQ